MSLPQSTKSVGAIATVVFVLLTIKPVWSQNYSGTIIVWVYTKDQVAVAADSRATFLNGGFDDHNCKINPLSEKLIFTATGIVGVYSNSLAANLRFGAFGEARQAVSLGRDPRLPDQGFVHNIAARWLTLMQDRFLQAAPAQLAEWRGGMSGDAFDTGIFLGIDSSGRIAITSRTFEYGRLLGDTSDVPYATGYDYQPGDHFRIGRAGAPEAVRIVDAQSKQLLQDPKQQKQWQKLAKSEDGLAKVAIRLVDLAISSVPDSSQHPSPIGGKIDAIEISRRRGMRWVQSPNCANSTSIQTSLPFLH